MLSIVDAIVAKSGGPGTLTVVDAADGQTERPWSAVHERARRMAAVLTGGGPTGRRWLPHGGRIGILGDTSLDLVCAIQAAWLTGSAVTMLPLPTRADQPGYAAGLVALVKDAGLDAVVVEQAVAPVEAALAAATGLLRLADLAAGADAAAPAEPVHPAADDLAVLQYTSGSTRSPRGVPVTHAHLAANIAAIKEQLDHEASHPSVMLSWLPLYHDMGLVGFLTLPMSCGCPLVLQATAGFARRPASWLEHITRYRASITCAPNFAYRLMTRLLVAGVACDLSSLRLMLSGAEPVDAAAMAAFADAARPRGLDPAILTPGYGLAESTLTVSHARLGCGIRVDRVDPAALETDGRAVPAPSGERGRLLVRLGHPVPGTELRVVDRVSGEPVGERIVGHVEIRGPSVVGHYWGDPRPAPGTWFRTGDLGYRTGNEPDEDAHGRPGPGVAGELVICGREKDVLFAAGRNVFPQDIEAVVGEIAGVRAGGAVAFGIADERGDRLVVAVETRREDLAVLRAEVAASVLGEVGLAAADIVTLPYGRLPKTSSGKLRRAEARRQYLAGELAAQRPGPTANPTPDGSSA